AVYCGSNFGNNRDFYLTAKATGKMLAEKGVELVYGGGKAGLMGAVADAALAAGGRVTGVIPTFLIEKELAHDGLQTLIQTADMPERKSAMINLADGYIALAGGIGTFEELLEVLSLAQLRQFDKPVGLINTAGFYNPLIQLLEDTVAAGFMPSENLDLLCVADTPEALWQKMLEWKPTEAQKWQRPAWLDEEGL
ncbi:MAG: TIGR00730 family Rossman fold protein, partial [Neisseria sp.]|nr:TIGR00730 family Rossman fold protein [Neisseria sp.]